jgi:hypothetical protein
MIIIRFVINIDFQYKKPYVKGYPSFIKEILKAPLEIRGKMKYSAHETFFLRMLSMNDRFIDLFFTFYVILSDFRRSKAA